MPDAELISRLRACAAGHLHVSLTGWADLSVRAADRITALSRAEEALREVRRQIVAIYANADDAYAGSVGGEIINQIDAALSDGVAA